MYISKQKGFQVTSYASLRNHIVTTSNHSIDKVLWVEVFDAGIAFRQVLITEHHHHPRAEVPLTYKTCKLYLGGYKNMDDFPDKIQCSCSYVLGTMY